MTPKRRRTLGRALRAAAVAGVVVAAWWLARSINLQRAWSVVAGASLPLVAAAAALNLVQVVWRALCLRVMLAPTRTVGVLALVRCNLAMYAANNLLPWRAGELVRIHLLAAREGVPVTTSTAVALVEKMFNVVALLLLALPLPWLLPGLPPSVARALILIGVLAAFGLAASFAVARSGEHASDWVARFARGAESVRRPGPFAAALGWSLAAYLTDAAEVVVCLIAVNVHLPFAASLLVLLAIAVALAVPSTPSGFGAMELSAVAALAILGVPSEKALAFGVVYHLIQLVPVTLLGLEGVLFVSASKSLRPLRGNTNGLPSALEEEHANPAETRTG